MARKLCVRNYSSSVQEPKNSVMFLFLNYYYLKDNFIMCHEWIGISKLKAASGVVATATFYATSNCCVHFPQDWHRLRNRHHDRHIALKKPPRFDRAVKYLPMRCPGNTKPVERLIFTIKLVPTNITISNSFQIQYSFQHTKVTSECRTIWQRNLEEL